MIRFLRWFFGDWSALWRSDRRCPTCHGEQAVVSRSNDPDAYLMPSGLWVKPCPDCTGKKQEIDR